MIPDLSLDPARDRCLAAVTMETRPQAGATGACLLIPSDAASPRVVSVTVTARAAVAGLRFEASAGTDKGLQVLYDPSARTVALTGEKKGEVYTCRAGGRCVHLAALVVGNHVDAFVNGQYLGTVAAAQPDPLPAFLVCVSPTGRAAFSEICCKSLPTAALLGERPR